MREELKEMETREGSRFVIQASYILDYSAITSCDTVVKISCVECSPLFTERREKRENNQMTLRAFFLVFKQQRWAFGLAVQILVKAIMPHIARLGSFLVPAHDSSLSVSVASGRQQ